MDRGKWHAGTFNGRRQALRLRKQASCYKSNMLATWEIESKWYAETARRIAAQADRQRITLYQLSARSGVPYLSTARYIREGRRMPAFALARYAQVLGVSVSDLVGETKEASHRR